MRLSLAALAAAALLAAPQARAAAPAAPAAGPAAAAPRAKKPVRAAKAAHPDVGAASDCASCHAEATPDVQLAWRQGKHGLALVKCFVCHGSTGDDFARRPAADRCVGCHGEQVASLAQGGRVMKGKDCFSCHEPHALSPHAPRADQTAAARLGADEELRRERSAAGPVNGPAAAPPPYTPPAPPAAATPAPAAAQPAAAQPAKDTKTAQPHPTTDKPQGSTP